MLLRSSSTAIPSLWLHLYSRDCSFAESEPIFHLPRARPLSLTTSKNCSPHLHGIEVIKESDEVEENPLKKTCSELVLSSGLGKTVVKHEEEVEIMGNGTGSNGCGGHGCGWDSSDDDDDGEDSTDSYYQKMIVTNPNNALVLGNYAKFWNEEEEEDAEEEDGAMEAEARRLRRKTNEEDRLPCSVERPCSAMKETRLDGDL